MSLDRPTVEPFLRTCFFGRGQYLWQEQMNSTNRMAAHLAGEGASSGDLVVCDHQTEGRGRMTRSWDASPGEDITLSVLWRPRDLTQAPLIPLTVAVAVYRTLCPFTKGLAIKWPNDILLHGKKVCGILCELHGEMAVIGIGLNVNRKNIPEELKEKASSLFLATGRSYELPKLLAELLFHLEEELLKFEKSGISVLRKNYLPLCASLNRLVRVLSPLTEWTGFAEDVDENGCLLVRDSSGQIHAVQAGDVSVRGLMGYTDEEAHGD